MGDVTELAVAKPQVDRSTVGILEELLDLARQGLIVQVCCVSFKPGGDYRTDCSELMDTLRRIGALRQIEHDILTSRDTK